MGKISEYLERFVLPLSDSVYFLLDDLYKKIGDVWKIASDFGRARKSR